jgi:hypothetical protein
MVSQKVEALRKVGVRKVVVTPMPGANRHQRRVEAAKAHDHSGLAKRRPDNWQQARRKARRTASESRRVNR